MRILIATKNKGKFGEIKGGLLCRNSRLTDQQRLLDHKKAGHVRLPGEADFEIHFLGDYQIDDRDFVEDGVTHEENARKKAKYYWEKFCEGGEVCARNEVCGCEGQVAVPIFDFVLGEDSGIYVDALRDELGVQTRRWGAGDAASDEEWLSYFMKEMKARAPEGSMRGAKFVCNACVVGRTGRVEDGVAAVSLDGRVGAGLIEEFFEGETLGCITDSVMAPILPGLPLSSVFLPFGFDKVYAALSREEKNRISHRGQAVGKVREWLEGMG